MSTATLVPETWELTGDDARKTLAATGRGALLRDAFERLRAADGFSHARSLAFVTSLVLVQGLVVLVGFSVLLGETGVSRVIVAGIRSAVPGPASEILVDAVQQAGRVGNQNKYLPLVLGLVGTLFTGMTAMGQFERAMNRIYGIEKDRPTLKKYGRALVLAVTAGTLIALAFALLALGNGIRGEMGDSIRGVWTVVQWPLAVFLAVVGLDALFRWSPRRRQPAWSWLAFGAGLAVVLWTLVTLGLGLMFKLSSTFGDTYGPLAGIVALQIWTLLSAVAILFGVAVAAQLEAVRAGVREVREPVAEEIPRAAAPVRTP